MLNLNSSMRNYVPFGLRGTVVGKTQDKVIVLFDEQYLGGSDLNGFCESYRGAQINPNYLCNITMKFENLLRKGKDNEGGRKLLEKFTERRPGGEAAALEEEK